MELWRLLSNFCYFGPLSEWPRGGGRRGSGSLCRPARPASPELARELGCRPAGCAAPGRAAARPPPALPAPAPAAHPRRAPPPSRPAGIDFFFHIYFLIKYSKSLEEGSFRNRSADFLWMLLFGSTLLTLMAPFVNVQFLGSALTFMMVGGSPP